MVGGTQRNAEEGGIMREYRGNLCRIIEMDSAAHSTTRTTTPSTSTHRRRYEDAVLMRTAACRLTK